MLRHLRAGVLEIAFEETGAAGGWPAVLLHGFPYDVHAYDEVAPLLAREGARVIVPYLRGYGPTRFLSAETPRSGQQAALAFDLLARLDALEIPTAVLAGYDWGGRAACVLAALWPDRVQGLVSLGGYNIQNIARSHEPQPPESEYRYWYQYYFHSERGREGLRRNRRELCRLLWRLWSPTWPFDAATYARSAAAFDNPDFVDVVTHSYRHRFGLAAGDPALEEIERRLVPRPAISVPAMTLEGAADGVTPPVGPQANAAQFKGRSEYRLVADAGHNLPQERPAAFADAVLTVRAWTS
jgi:pimeloyl-ACP methyl ester carboxylesterase